MRFTLRHDPGATELPKLTHTFVFMVRSALSPTDTFEFLADNTKEGLWFPDFVEAKWETPAPQGVGSRRLFQTDMLWLRERFVAWTPGERFAFVGTETSLPLVRSFAEDYRIRPNDNGGCTIEWKILYEPREMWRPLHPVMRPYFGRLFRQAAQSLERELARVATPSYA